MLLLCVIRDNLIGSSQIFPAIVFHLIPLSQRLCTLLKSELHKSSLLIKQFQTNAQTFLLNLSSMYSFMVGYLIKTDSAVAP